MSKQRNNKYNQEMEKWRRLKQPRYITGLAGLTEQELPAYRPDMAYLTARSPDAFKENAYTFSQGKRVPLKGSPALFPFADQNTIFKAPNQIAQMPNGMDAFPQSKYIDPRFATPEELESFFNVSALTVVDLYVATCADH